MKKILIIGGSSLLSLNLIFFFRKKYKVYLACNTKKPKCLNVDSFFINFKKKGLIKILERVKPHKVIICSAITNIELCENNKTKSKKINYELPKILTDLSKTHSYDLIFISTDQVYKDNHNHSNEKSKILGVNFYSKMKIDAEIYIKKKIKNFLIVRTNFFGYGPTFRKSFSDNILHFALKKRKKIYFDDNIFSAIYLPYLARALSKLIDRNIKGVYNICSPNSISKYGFAIKLFETFSLDKRYIIQGFLSERKDLVNRPINMSMSNNKLTRKLSLNLPKIETQIKRMKKEFNSEYFNFLKKLKWVKKKGKKL